MAGKVGLLNVWASWWVACREEHPVPVACARTALAVLEKIILPLIKELNP
jgi:hypothetical protein